MVALSAKTTALTWMDVLFILVLLNIGSLLLRIGLSTPCYLEKRNRWAGGITSANFGWTSVGTFLR